GAKEGVVFACSQLADIEFDRSGFAAANDRCVGNHACVVRFDVVVVQAGGHAVGGGALLVGFFGNDNVVAHGRLGQLSGVLQIDGEFSACFINNDFLGVELHGVVAFNGDITLGRQCWQAHNGQKGGESGCC